jgi:hypothetical protein
MMCLGVFIGGLAFWLEGYDLPVLLEPQAVAAPSEGGQGVEGRVEDGTGRHWYSGGWLVRGQDVPAAACYLAYFGLTFFLLRWWKMADRRRPHRFSFYALVVPALCCWVLTLFLWPQDANAKVSLVDSATVILVPVMAAVIIQLVSPWEAPPPRKSRKLRLANA